MQRKKPAKAGLFCPAATDDTKHLLSMHLQKKVFGTAT